jgi:hypothetical protein
VRVLWCPKAEALVRALVQAPVPLQVPLQAEWNEGRVPTLEPVPVRTRSRQ